MVGVASSWGKQDLIQHYHLPEDKVQVVPWAPMLTVYPTPSGGDLISVQRKFSLPEAFIFYPAQTWAHKNHIGLLEALAILRDRHGLIIHFVSSGRLSEFFPAIQRRARELRLVDQVRFLGFVSPLELQSLYTLCNSVVIPSKFEAASFPLWEAFLAGVPVACSNVTSLPRQAGDAALIFDPDRPEEIAEAILSLWTEEALRRTLGERSKMNVARFTWDRTARAFRAHYRRLANRPLTQEDRELLAAPPLL
jgi:glycosyltransferase involved in cell wall biosynthesis